jgi:hypothetical protein
MTSPNALRGVLLGFLGAASGAALASCSRAEPPPPAAVARESLGNVMVAVGRRFETAGRAGAAGRWELADFEASELEELFEDDVPAAAPPKEGPTAHLPAMAKAFTGAQPPALKKAAQAKDAKAFAAAFAQAAAACNDCHKASEKAFIVVPAVPGKAVPDVDPAPSAP